MIRIFISLILISFCVSSANAEVKPEYSGNLTFLRAAQASNLPDISGLTFSPDGKRVFVGNHRKNFVGKNIFQFDLDTAWDISTLDISSEVTASIMGHGQNPANHSKLSIEFNNDGTKIFILGGFFASTHIYNLTTAYDISSMSSDTIVPDDGIDWTDFDGAVSGVSSLKYDIDFNNDGTKMYLLDGHINSSNIMEYNLSTPYDQSTASFSHLLDLESELALYAMELEFDDDGTRMYVTEATTSPSTNYIYVYKLSTPFAVSSSKYVGKYQIAYRGSTDETGAGYTFQFGKQGMKLYLTTNEFTHIGGADTIYDDVIYEYDLSCPYGVVICEEDTVSNTSAQVDVAKQAIHQNSSVIFKRFDWLRRNEGNENLNTNNINLNINNPILSALSDTLKNTFNQKYTKASVKNKKETRSNFKNLSFWSHGDISIGRTGDKATTTPQTLKVGGLMFGVDKKLKNNKFVGAAIRYGQGNTYNKTSDGFKLDSETLTLNLYSTNQLDSKLNLNTLLGLSFLKIDQLNSSDQVTGNRNGKQLFTAINMNSDGGYGEFNIRPTGGFMFGITSLSSYTDFNTSSVQDIYDSLVFNTGNITAGLKFDKLVEKTDFNLFRNGSIEYIQDLSSNIGYTVKSHSDLTSQRKSVKRHSLHNLKVNFGMESVSESGHTFGLNFERLQGLDESSHLQSLFFKFGYLRENNTDIAFNFDPLTSNTANLSYLKHYNYFDLKLDTNYSFMDENPGYGLNLQLSNTF